MKNLIVKQAKNCNASRVTTKHPCLLPAGRRPAAVGGALGAINIMKKTTAILLLILASTHIMVAQNKAFKFGIRTQLSTGVISTYSENIHKEYVDGRETHSGLQQSLQISIFTPINIFNIGLGTGLSLRTGSEIYPSTIIPKVFLMIEIGNGKKRSRVSGILNTGIMQGSIENKSCFYVGGGPSFNIFKEFRTVTVSINPYFEFHMGEKATRYYLDTHWSQQGTQYSYTRHFKTLTINLSCIVQFNFNRKAKKTN
jgi:hypothetical protein